jgi:hypothetical protein
MNLYNPTELSLPALFLGLTFSVFGFYFFKEGKKNSNFIWVFIGIAMIIFPYFIPNNGWKLVFGVAMMTLAYKQRS